MALFPVPNANLPSPLPQQQPQPNFFDKLGSGLANVLAAMQQDKENKFRQQELADRRAQEQALAEYYRGMVSVQGQEQARLANASALSIAQRREVGGAMQRALGIGDMTTTLPGQSMGPQRGNATQGMNAGLLPGEWDHGQLGNATQAGPGFADQQQGMFQQFLADAARAIQPAVAPSSGGPSSIFAGVAPENIPAAVEGVQAAQNLSKTTLPQPTADIQNFREFLRVSGIPENDPRVPGMLWQLIGPKPGTTINNIPAKGETKFAEKLGELQAGQVGDFEKNANLAAQAFPALNEAYSLVNRSFTGFGSAALLNMARVAKAAGVLDAAWKPGKDKIADTQFMIKNLREQTLAYLQTRALGSGTAVSDRDREFMERMSGADISLDQQTIKKIIRVNVGIGVERMQDAIDALHAQAQSYPESAKRLHADAEAIQRKLLPLRRRYAQMLQDEGDATTDVRRRLQLIPGIQLPGGP